MANTLLKNKNLDNGVGGIYKSSGTIPNNTVATLTSSGNFIFDYFGGTNALALTDGLGIEINSPNGGASINTYNGSIQATTGSGRQLTVDSNGITLQHDYIAIDNRQSSLAGVLRFLEPSGSNYFSLQAQAMTADYAFIWPANYGTSGHVLTTNGSGTLSWAAPSGAVVADGDYGDITVSSSGTVWNIDADAVTNTELASGTGGIYKGSGTIAPASGAFLEEDATFTFAYSNTNPAIQMTDFGGTGGQLSIRSATGDAQLFINDNSINTNMTSGPDIQITSGGTIDLAYTGGHVTIGGSTAASELRFMEPSGSGTHYTGFIAPALAANLVYTLPTSATDGYFLKYNSAGNQLEWAAASGGNGIYGGDGTLQAGTTNATLPASGIFRLEYAGGNAGLIVDDLNSATTIFSKDGTQYFSADNTQSIIGSGTSKMEYIDGVLRLYDSDATHYIAIQTPATGSLTTNYTLTLPVDDGTSNQVLKTDGSGNLSWTTVAGGGDILNGGNTTGAAVTIGTNDANALNLKTNNVERLSITGGASTGGAFTFTNVTANTNTVQDVFTIRSNSTGTVANNFGVGLLFQGESSTTDNRDMVRLSAIWTTATDGSRASALVYSDVTGGGALTERFRFTPTGMITNTAYTIGGSGNSITLGGSGGLITLSTANTTGIAISTTHNTASSTSNITFGNATSFTQISGTRNYINCNWGFAPTSGTAVHNQLSFTGTFNQTGGANGITRGIFLNQALTAVADFRGIEIAYSNSNAKGVYQTGANTTNNFVGRTAFGTTSAPDASTLIDMVSTSTGLGLPSMTTAQVNAISSPRDGVLVYDADTDEAKLRANSEWVSLATTNALTKRVINTQTGTSYTLVLSDAGKLVTLDNASAIALDIPTNASVAFPIGTIVDIAQLGAGQVTVGGTGVTINSADGDKKLRVRYSSASLIKTATDTWLLVGDIAA